MKRSSILAFRSPFIGLLLLVFFICPGVPFAQWSVDQKISTIDTSAGLNENMGQCLAVSGDSFHAVWMNTKSGDRAVYYKHSYDGGLTWTGETKLTGPTSAADFPSIAASGSTVHIMWRDTIGAQNVNYYIRSLDGGKTWGPKVFFGNWYWWPSITCVGNMVFVALNSNDPGNSEVWFQRSTDNGTTWDSVKRISNAPGRSEDPSISASDGHVYLVWNDNRDSTTTIPKSAKMQAYARVSTDNGVTWGAETLWNNPPTKSYFPFVHASGPNVDFTWGDLRTTYQIFYKHSSDYGMTWSAEQQLSSGGGGDYPVVTRNGSDVHIEWFLFGATAGLTYRHSSDGGITWDAPLAVVDAKGNPSSPFLVANGSTLHTIWLDQRDGYHAVYYKRNPPGKTTSGKFSTSTFSVSFGSVVVGTIAFDTITIQNVGGATLNMLNYSIVAATGGFKLIDPLPYAIPSNGSASVIVQFNSQQPIIYSGALIIQTDEAAASFDTILLSGMGVIQELLPGLDISPSPFDFGKVDSGGCKYATVTVTNNGKLSVTISRVATSGEGFSEDSTMKNGFFTLPPGMSMPLYIVFCASKPGSHSGVITMHVSTVGDPDSVFSIPLRGTFRGKNDTTSGSGSVPTSYPLLSILEVSPNPAWSNATLKLCATKQLENVKLYFYDGAARLVRTQEVGSLGEGVQNIPLVLPQMSGVSFMRITAGGQMIGTVGIAITR